MMRTIEPGRRLVRCLGLAAAAIFVLSAATSQRAEAVSLINPGGAPAAKHVSDGMTTEVRGGGGGGHGGGGHGGGGHGWGGGGGHFHGGGGGAVFHSSGFRSGGAVFHGGGFRTGHVFHGGGFRHGDFAFRHHRFHRHFYAPYYYDDYPYYYGHRCRLIWTYYGPHRVCHYRHWRHHYWRHHYRHHRHYRYY